MPPKKPKPKENIVKDRPPPAVAGAKKKDTREVTETATSSRPKRSTAVSEAAEQPAPVTTKSKAIKDTTAIQGKGKRAADATTKLDGEIKSKKSKSESKRVTASAKPSLTKNSPGKSKLPPSLKSAPNDNQAVAKKPRGRPPKAKTEAVKEGQLSNKLKTKTADRKTPSSSYEFDMGDLISLKSRRGSSFSVELPKSDAINGHGANLESDEDDESEEEGEPAYWLMKAEPESRIEKGIDVKFSIDDLEKVTEPEPWNGVRNFTARNNMRLMRKGELAFFYHSNCKVPGVTGIMKIVQEHSTDSTALDPDHPYYDPKATEENPRWEVVHVALERKFGKIVTLKELKKYSLSGGILENMATLKQSRLSISRVTKKEWEFILKLAASHELETTESLPVDKASLGNGDM